MVWLRAKQAVMLAIPEMSPKPSACRIAAESSARTIQGTTTANHENARKAKPVPALRRRRTKKVQVIFPPMIIARLRLRLARSVESRHNAWGVARAGQSVFPRAWQGLQRSSRCGALFVKRAQGSAHREAPTGTWSIPAWLTYCRGSRRKARGTVGAQISEVNRFACKGAGYWSPLCRTD